LFSLKEKTAIISGGSKGIGKAIAFKYAEAGANVVICSRKKDKDLEASVNNFLRLLVAISQERQKNDDDLQGSKNFTYKENDFVEINTKPLNFILEFGNNLAEFTNKTKIKTNVQSYCFKNQTDEFKSFLLQNDIDKEEIDPNTIMYLFQDLHHQILL
jgi:short-subunit dehydrogenase involved in D-alanine esterification of teichoic acids